MCSLAFVNIRLRTCFRPALSSSSIWRSWSRFRSQHIGHRTIANVSRVNITVCLTPQSSVSETPSDPSRGLEQGRPENNVPCIHRCANAVEHRCSTRCHDTTEAEPSGKVAYRSEVKTSSSSCIGPTSWKVSPWYTGDGILAYIINDNLQ